MKKIVFSLVVLLSVPFSTQAVFNVSQGGTGVTSFPVGAFLFGNGTSPLQTTYSPSFSFINATSTNATSTFGGDVDILGELKVGEDFWVHPFGSSDIRVSGTMAMNQNGGSIDLTDTDFITIWASIFSDGPNQINLRGGGTGSGFVGVVLDFSKASSGGGDNAHRFFFPDFTDGTFGLLETDQVWTGNNIFNQGDTATTTVTFGQMGSTTSKSCFNTKNTDGDDVSFYFVGTSMVVENNTCR